MQNSHHQFPISSALSRLLFVFEMPQEIIGSEKTSPTRTDQSQYAVPVTIETLSKGFVAHKFLIARHCIPQMKMFHRALYTIEFRDSSSRRIKRQLPSEVIYMITQYVKAAAIEQGFSDCERQIGGPNRSTYVELEEGLRRLERWGRSKKGLTAWPPEDAVCLGSQHFTQIIWLIISSFPNL